MTTSRKTDHGLVVCSEGKTLFIPTDDLPGLLPVALELLQEKAENAKVRTSVIRPVT